MDWKGLLALMNDKCLGKLDILSTHMRGGGGVWKERHVGGFLCL